MKKIKTNLNAVSALEPELAISIPPQQEFPYLSIVSASHDLGQIFAYLTKACGTVKPLTRGGVSWTRADVQSMFNVDRALHSALHAAQIGRQIIMSYYGRIRDVQEKDQAGLVSEADRESEIAITQFLRQEHPEFSVLGEEESFANQGFGPVEKLRQSGIWLVDPLDGTTNYVHRLPIFCVSIGLLFEGELQVGVIDVPTMQKVYSAARGRGAFCNGEPIHVSERNEIRGALLATGFSSYDTANLNTQLRVFGELVAESRGVRRAGSAAYDLCLVAEGVFDGYWEGSLKPWDTGAGTLIVREAGGVVTTYDGKNYDPFDSSLIAANPILFPKLKGVIQKHHQIG